MNKKFVTPTNDYVNDFTKICVFFTEAVLFFYFKIQFVYIQIFKSNVPETSKRGGDESLQKTMNFNRKKKDLDLVMLRINHLKCHL